MRWRYLIACSGLGLGMALGIACSDSHSAARADGDDAPQVAGDAAGSSSSRTPTAVPAAGSNTPRDPASMMMAPAGEAGRASDGPRMPGADPEAPAGQAGQPGQGSAAGGDGTNAPGDPQRPIDPAGSALGQALLGHWYSDGGVGNCVAPRNHYRFEASGALSNLGIDHNACQGDRLFYEGHGTFELEGRDLLLTLDGPGSERVPDMRELTVDVAQHHQRMTIAIGERPATVDRPAQTYLDGKAFGSSEGQHFTSVRSDVFLAPDVSTLFAQKVFVTLRTSQNLRELAAGSALTVEISAGLSQSLVADPMTTAFDEIAFAYPAVLRDELGWRRIMPVALDGLSGQDAIDAWQQLLSRAGIDAHPEWARRLLQFHFYPSQRYQPDNVTVLSSTLPEYGHWTRSEEPLVVPGVAP